MIVEDAVEVGDIAYVGDTETVAGEEIRIQSSQQQSERNSKQH